MHITITLLLEKYKITKINGIILSTLTQN